MIHEENTYNLDLYIWDVGHGLSVTVVTPYIGIASNFQINRRRVIQVDAGINGQYEFSPIKHLVEKRGLHTIDCLMISHVDRDHIDDLDTIDDLQQKEKLEIITLLRNKTFPTNLISDDQSQESPEKTFYRKLHSTYIFPVSGPNSLIPKNYGGLIINSCYLDYREGLDSNNSSLVVSISFGNTQIIIPGDIDGNSVLELKALGKLPNPKDGYRILIAPHHGRESAEPVALVEHYRPSIVLASAKEEDEYTDNIFSSSNLVTGHPVFNSDGQMSMHKFNATKGEAFHINIDPNFGYLPIIKRVSYDKKHPSYDYRNNLIEQILKMRSNNY